MTSARISLAYRGDWHSPSGFGQAARSTFDALTAAGMQPIAVSCPKDPVQHEGCWSGKVEQAPASADVWVHHLPPSFYDVDLPGRHAASFAWETSRLPKRPVRGVDWAQTLNRLDEIWVPAGFLRDVLERSGVTTETRVIPHPIDTERYCPGPPLPMGRSAPPGYDPDWTVFLYVGTWDARKQPDVLIRAFCKAFTASDRALLIIKSYATGNPTRDAPKLYQRLMAARCGDAHVHLLPQVLAEARMIDLYRTCTAFVTASRGEGFCLPAVEAMSCGKPVLAVGWSAFEDYVSAPVGYELEDVPTGTKLEGYEAGQRWARVDEDSLIETLRRAHQDRDRLTQLGADARTWVQDHVSLLRVGRQMKERVEALVADG